MVIRIHQNSKTQVLPSMIIYSYATEIYLNRDRQSKKEVFVMLHFSTPNKWDSNTDRIYLKASLASCSLILVSKHKLLYKLYIYNLYNCIYLPYSKVPAFGGISLCSFAFLGVWVFSLGVREWCGIILFSLKINPTCTPTNRHLPSLKMITPFSSLPVLLVL